MNKLNERLRELIEAVTENRHRDQKMFEKTGISADKWKKFWFNRKAADAEMIEAVAIAWPEHAFWLVTGIDDFTHGHTSPANQEIQHEWLSPRHSDRKVAQTAKQRMRSAAKDYFLKRIEFDQWSAQTHDHNDINVQRKENDLYSEIISLNLIRKDQETTLGRIEEAGIKDAHKEMDAQAEQAVENMRDKKKKVGSDN